VPSGLYCPTPSQGGWSVVDNIVEVWQDSGARQGAGHTTHHNPTIPVTAAESGFPTHRFIALGSMVQHAYRHSQSMVRPPNGWSISCLFKERLVERTNSQSTQHQVLKGAGSPDHMNAIADRRSGLYHRICPKPSMETSQVLETGSIYVCPKSPKSESLVPRECPGSLVHQHDVVVSSRSD
jgi:hypothetical protein